MLFRFRVWKEDFILGELFHTSKLQEGLFIVLVPVVLVSEGRRISSEEASDHRSCISRKGTFTSQKCLSVHCNQFLWVIRICYWTSLGAAELPKNVVQQVEVLAINIGLFMKIQLVVQNYSSRDCNSRFNDWFTILLVYVFTAGRMSRFHYFLI